LRSWLGWVPWAIIAAAIMYVVLFGVLTYADQSTPASDLPVQYWLLVAGRVALIALAAVALTNLWQSPRVMSSLCLLLGLMWLALALFQVTAVGWNGESLSTASSGVAFLLGGLVGLVIHRTWRLP
jgi:hypothetical protein